jgi:hypothetical protein
VPAESAACATNFTEDGWHSAPLKNSLEEMVTETKPFISTLGVGVSGVTKKGDVSVGCAEVGEIVGVNVCVLCPTSGGVGVNVDVGMMGVKV